MLDFEAALARAQASCAVIPKEAAPVIAAYCDAMGFDIVQLASATAKAGNVAIPLVKELTRQVAQADADVAGYVHWGATSQDAIDTGLVLQLRAALDLLERDCALLEQNSRELARRHAGTVMAGRTWLQQAVPVTLGLKAAGWVDALARHRQRLAAQRKHLVVQFGGAAGTLASLGESGMAVARALGAELGLGVPAIAWHTQRDRVAEFATTCGLLVGTLGKIARDLTLMMQSELGEVAEPHAPGRGGSSTMPHKRNPVACVAVLSAAQRVPGLVSVMLSAMVQEHERGAGGWHAEWETLPEICILTDGALVHLNEVIAGLEVHSDRMRANLDLLHGLNLAEAVSMALATRVGRANAHAIVEQACAAALAGRQPLIDALESDARVRAHLDRAALSHLLDPAHYLGSTRLMIDAVLAHGDGAPIA
jgi:3-carboxy-cis,cis-muconate cycloisomerase